MLGPELQLEEGDMSTGNATSTQDPGTFLRLRVKKNTLSSHLQGKRF